MSGPKLLDKKVVTAELATQRKQQIDSGLAIAKKVDVIRDTLQTEEQNLERFRTETVKKVQIEIDSYIRQREGVKEEIRVLEKIKTEALIPLDAEWEEVTKAQNVCNEWEQELEGRQVHINNLQQTVEQALSEATIQKGRADERTDRATNALIKAEAIEKQAREDAATVRNTAHAALLEAELKFATALIKEQELMEREETIEATRVQQQEKAIEQATHDRTIQDKYATLADTIRRIKK